MREAKPLRLILVTRRFWPLVGGAEKASANLAVALADRGCCVTLLTAHWDPTWPVAIHFHGQPVIRLPPPAVRSWGTLRYLWALRRWLRSHRGRYDLVYVSMLREEAYAVLGAVPQCTPVVLRAEGGGASGDCRWQEAARWGWWIGRRCRKNAAAIVAPTASIRDELLAAGYDASRVRLIPNGVALPPERTPLLRSAARRALADTHLSFQLSPDAPLAMFAGRLLPSKGLLPLLTAWKTVLCRRGSARLWLIGDGPQQAELEKQLAALNLRGRVVLGGAFDNIDTLLAAADLYVLPSYEEGQSLALLEAMAAGLPIVASDLPAHRALVEHQRHGLLTPPGSAEQLAAAMLRIMDEPGLAESLGSAARTKAQEFSLRNTVDHHLELFESLQSKRS